MPVVIDAPRTATLGRPAPKLDRHAAALEAARAAGRLSGERLNRTPLTPRQRATVAAVLGGNDPC